MTAALVKLPRGTHDTLETDIMEEANVACSDLFDTNSSVIQ